MLDLAAVSRGEINKDSGMHKYIVFQIFSSLGYYKISNIVSCAIKALWFFISVVFHSRVNLLILNPYFIPPSPMSSALVTVEVCFLCLCLNQWTHSSSQKEICSQGYWFKNTSVRGNCNEGKAWVKNSLLQLTYS